MYEIYFYKDKNGKEPVKEYIAGLAAKNDKDSRIKLNKIMDYVKTLFFMKRTQKTPLREMERAKRNLADYRGRKHHENE